MKLRNRIVATTLKRSVLLSVILAIGTLLPECPATGATLPVTVDTNSVYGTNGFLDIQFNPDTTGITPLDATALITNATVSGGAFGAVDTVNSNNYIGALPGTVTISNSGVTNVFVQGITFGSALHFDFELDASSTPGADSGSTFVFYLLGADQNTLPTTDASRLDRVAELDLASDGTQSGFQTFALNVPITASEPSSVLPCLIGLLGTAWLIRRRK